MTVPTAPTYTAAILTAGNDEFLAGVDSGTGAGTIKISDSADILLAQITLTDPSGTVDGVTGVLTFTAASQTNPLVGGIAAYAEICDSDDNVHLSIPCAESATAVTGYMALNSLTLVAGEPLSLTSFTVG